MILDKFDIIERIKNSLYYVIFKRIGLKSQSIGICMSESGATQKVKAFAKRNKIENYLTIYSKNHI